MTGQIEQTLEDLITEADAIADLLIAKGRQIKKICLRTKKELTSVSTPVLRKGLSDTDKAKIIVRRELFIQRSLNKKPAVAAAGKK